MSYTNDQNPSDQGGTLGHGQTTIGFVVDVDDPKELGRVRVRIPGLQDQSRVPDDQLPWISCAFNNQPSNKGVGFGPANYMVGSTVVCQYLGQQGYLVMASVPNVDEQENRTDVNEETKSNTPLIPALNNPKNQNKNRHETLQTSRGTSYVLQIKNTGSTSWAKTDSQQYYKPAHMEAKVPMHHLGRAAARNIDKLSIGVEPFIGQFKNPQQFIQSKIGDAGSVIPGALSMLENLKKVTNPLQVPLPTTQIGAGNLLQAIQGLLSLFKQNKKEQEDNTQEQQQELTEEEKKALEEQQKAIEELEAAIAPAAEAENPEDVGVPTS